MHTDDVAGAMWACAEWMASLGRKAADEKAGEDIPFHNDKAKVAEVEGMIPPGQKVKLPLFNLVSRGGFFMGGGRGGEGTRRA